jgi:hypothetical protein
MADTKNLPEGTDAVIAGGGTTADPSPGRSGTTFSGGNTSGLGNATGGRTSTTGSDQTGALITGGDPAGLGGGAGAGSMGGAAGGLGGGAGAGSMGGATAGGGTETTDSSDTSGGGVAGLVSNATAKVKEQAGTKAVSFIGQGLQQGGTTLTNIASLVEDTVQQIEERLGPQYGEYARTASQTLNRYATTLQNKNPDELVDDARDIIRKSPGVALGAAAAIGFGLVRLVKAGLPEGGSNGTANRDSDRAQ